MNAVLFLLHSGILVAVVACSLRFTTASFQQIHPPGTEYLFLFFSVFSVYLADRILFRETDRSNLSQRAGFFSDHRRLLTVIGILSAAAGGAAWLFLPIPLKLYYTALIPPAALYFLLGRLRLPAFLKPLLLAFTWSLAVSAGSDLASVGKAALLVFFPALVNAMYFDLRDLDADAAAGKPNPWRRTSFHIFHVCVSFAIAAGALLSHHFQRPEYITVLLPYYALLFFVRRGEDNRPALTGLPRKFPHLFGPVLDLLLCLPSLFLLLTQAG